MGNITIEQFAAFLDGNLAGEELQQVEAAIAADKAYSEILGEAMQVDELEEVYMSQAEILAQEIKGMEDMDLPVIPECTDTADTVVLTMADPSASDPEEVVEAGIHSVAASETVEEIDLPSPDDYNVDSQSDESIDFGDIQ